MSLNATPEELRRYKELCEKAWLDELPPPDACRTLLSSLPSMPTRENVVAWEYMFAIMSKAAATEA
jgi:hypothetical protein